MAKSYKKLIKCIVEGEDEETVEIVQDLLDAGNDPMEIIREGLVAGMDIVSEEFKNGDIFVPEVLMSAAAMNAGISLVKPYINEGDLKSLGVVVIGTVEGDLHDIGKNLVAMLMESAGFKVIDLGVDVKAEQFIQAANENKADIIAMSAMLTTTMRTMEKVVQACKAEALPVQIMIGGAPVSDYFGNQIGAIYTPDAATAVDTAKKLLQ